MKELKLNENNMKDSEINVVVTRVKALICNSNNEILLGYCDGVYQFPGGHVEDGEILDVAVKREILEETGIDLEAKALEAFYCIKHYTRNFHGDGINELSQLYYFYVETDEIINIEKIKYTEREKKGGYRLEYIKLDNVEEILTANIPNNKRNSTIVKEMLTVLEEKGLLVKK